MDRFNLIITCQRNRESVAIHELESIFFLLGDPEARFAKSIVKGLILGYTNLDIHSLHRDLIELIRERPFDFRNTKRYIPIDVVVDTELELIREAALELARNIPRESTYKIVVEKRFTKLGSREIIDAIAPEIDRKVSLEEPDYILLIEVIGLRTGVSVVRPFEVVSVDKVLYSD